MVFVLICRFTLSLDWYFLISDCNNECSIDIATPEFSVIWLRLFRRVVISTGTGSASLALAKAQGIELDENKHNAPRCVTASLKVDYKKPTPIDSTLEIRGTVKELKGRKVIIEARVISNGEVCVTGEIIAIHVHDDFGKTDNW